MEWWIETLKGQFLFSSKTDEFAHFYVSVWTTGVSSGYSTCQSDLDITFEGHHYLGYQKVCHVCLETLFLYSEGKQCECDWQVVARFKPRGGAICASRKEGIRTSDNSIPPRVYFFFFAIRTCACGVHSLWNFRTLWMNLEIRAWGFWFWIVRSQSLWSDFVELNLGSGGFCRVIVTWQGENRTRNLRGALTRCKVSQPRLK